MEKDASKYKLSKEEHEHVYRLLEFQTFEGKFGCDLPVAVVLGGQPGCGKSRLIASSKKEFKDNNVVIINGDEYRTAHPNSNEILFNDEEDFAFYTDFDVRDWTKRLFDKAINDKYNFIFEGTMRTNAICDTIKRIKSKGFEVKIKVLSVNGVESLLCTIERYEEQKNGKGYGRMTPSESHRAAYYGMLNTLEEIEKERCFDTLEILTRKGEIIYSNDINNNIIYSKYDMSLCDTLVKNRKEQKLSMEEVEKRLKAISKSREERGDSPLEIDDIIEKMRKFSDDICI